MHNRLGQFKYGNGLSAGIGAIFRALEERKRIRRSNAPTRRTREQTKSATLGGMPCAYIDDDAEGPFSLSRCGLVASAGISFAVVCASQAPVDAPGPYWCRCIRLLSLALLPAPFSVLASRIHATRTCSRELE